MPLRTANQLGRSHIDSHQFELVHILTRVYESGFGYARGNIQSTLMQLNMRISCSRLTGAQELRKLSCKLALLNSHQLSCNSCSRLTEARELRKLFSSTLMQLLFSFDRGMRVEKTLMQTLASQVSSTLM